jgi:TolB-like protein/Tfp pilus assembly protein PilF
LPFEGEREEAALYSIIHQPHEPVTAIRAGVPLEFDRLLSKALAKEPDQRYQHLDDMLVDLRALRGKPLQSSPVTVPRRPSRRNALWAGAGALTVALALLLGPIRDRFAGLPPGVTGAPRIASIAVLPLGNFSGDPEQEYFSDGLTETLIASLAKIGALKVTSRTSVMQYKRTDKPLRQIASELGVDAVIEGSAQRSGDRVRITAQLIDAKSDQHLWADTYDRPVADVLGLQSEVAREIARQVNVTVTPGQESRLTGVRKINPKVYEAYLRGRFYVSQNTPESFEKGMKLLHEAVAIDPAEPLAYVVLAEGYITLGHGGAERLDSFPRAKAAAEQALKLDPKVAEAVGVLADVALYYEWDWVKAENLFKRALELNASLAGTHYHYAWYLALFDRLDEAIVEHKLARDLDPLQPLNTAWLGLLYNYAGRYDEAIVEAKKAIELDPRFAPSYQVLRFSYSRKGMDQEAIAAAQRLVELYPIRGNAQLGIAYALAGQREQALTIVAKWKRGTPATSYRAEFYAALGDRDAALRELEAAYEGHWTTLPWIRVHGGGFDVLRDDPRFQNLLRRMKLPL